MLFRACHIILCLIILISSTGLSINHHYCQGQIKSAALLVKANACGPAGDRTAQSEPFCPVEGMATLGKGRCCYDLSSFIKQLILKDSSSDGITAISPSKPQVLPLVLAFWETGVLHHRPVKINSSTFYRPPVLSRDLTIVLQTFLC